MQPIGESCLLWRVGQGASHANTARVHALYRRLRRARDAGEVDFLDAVPGYDSLAVHFDPLTTDVPRLQRRVDAWLGAIEHDLNEATDAGQTVRLPVRYDGPDLGRVAAQAELDAAEVARRHTRPTYTVAAIGFMPHFPYLLGLDPVLATPRLDAPRVRVPAGSVAIGGDQAGVYPRESPGGWNLIGRTDPALLTTLRPGDRVRFEVQAVSEEGAAEEGVAEEGVA